MARKLAFKSIDMDSTHLLKFCLKKLKVKNEDAIQSTHLEGEGAQQQLQPGPSLLDYAVTMKSIKCLHFLLEYGVNVYPTEGNYQDAPLYKAMSESYQTKADGDNGSEGNKIFTLLLRYELSKCSLTLM